MRWLFVLLCLAWPALAQRIEPEVVLEVEGPPDEVQAFTASLEQWGRASGVRWVPRSTAPSARVRATFLPEGCALKVYRGADTMVRDATVPRAGEAVLLVESAALLADAALEEILRSTPQEEPAPPVVEAPVDVVAPEAPVQLVAGAFFQARTYDTKFPVLFGGGLAVTSVFNTGAFRPSLTLLVSYQGPVSQRGASVPITVQLQTLGLRLLPGVERRFGPVTLGLEAGGGLDVLFAVATPGEGLPMERVLPARVDPAPFASVALVARVQVANPIALSLRLMADFDPAPRRYSALDEKLLEPWSVRAAAQLGFEFDFALGAR